VEEAECRLHPLIHTFALANVVQSVGTEQKRRECGLKYVIQSLWRAIWTLDSNDL